MGSDGATITLQAGPEAQPSRGIAGRVARSDRRRGQLPRRVFLDFVHYRGDSRVRSVLPHRGLGNQPRATLREF